MKTFFGLNLSRDKVCVLDALNIQWNKVLNGVGNFSIQLRESDWNGKGIVYVYRDGGKELGIIQKLDKKFTIGSLRYVQVSGVFMEGLLNNIPAVPFAWIRQTENFNCPPFYQTGTDDLLPPIYDYAIAKENVYMSFDKSIGGLELNSTAAVRACRVLSQVMLHELEKYLQHYTLSGYITPYDDVDVNYVTEEGMAKWDAADTASPKDKVSTNTSVPKEDGTITDQMGRQLFAIPKGSTQYLGDVLYSWLNGCWVTGEDIAKSIASGLGSSATIPPFCPTLRCVYDPFEKLVKITFDFKVNVVNSINYDEDDGNVESYSVTQDISGESALGIAKVVYSQPKYETAEDGTLITKPQKEVSGTWESQTVVVDEDKINIEGGKTTAGTFNIDSKEGKFIVTEIIEHGDENSNAKWREKKGDWQTNDKSLTGKFDIFSGVKKAIFNGVEKKYLEVALSGKKAGGETFYSSNGKLILDSTTGTGDDKKEIGTFTATIRFPVPKETLSEEGVARRDKYLNVSGLELNPLKTGKIEVNYDYSGEFVNPSTIVSTNPTDNDYSYYARARVKELLNNFNNADTTVTYTVTPILEDMDDDYSNYYDIGDMIKFNGEYLRVVAINEVVKNNIQSIELTLAALHKNMFKSYYASTNNPFDLGKTR